MRARERAHLTTSNARKGTPRNAVVAGPAQVSLPTRYMRHMPLLFMLSYVFLPTDYAPQFWVDVRELQKHVSLSVPPVGSKTRRAGALSNLSVAVASNSSSSTNNSSHAGTRTLAPPNRVKVECWKGRRESKKKAKEGLGRKGEEEEEEEQKEEGISSHTRAVPSQTRSRSRVPEMLKCFLQRMNGIAPLSPPLLPSGTEDIRERTALSCMPWTQVSSKKEAWERRGGELLLLLRETGEERSARSTSRCSTRMRALSDSLPEHPLICVLADGLLPPTTSTLVSSLHSFLQKRWFVRRMISAVYHLKYQEGARDPQVPPATQLAMRPPRLIASHHPKLYHGEIPSQRLALVLHHYALGPNSGTQQAELGDEALHSSSPLGALVAFSSSKNPSTLGCDAMRSGLQPTRACVRWTVGGGGPGGASLRLPSCIPLLVKLLVLALFSPTESTLAVFYASHPSQSPILFHGIRLSELGLWPSFPGHAAAALIAGHTVFVQLGRVNNQMAPRKPSIEDDVNPPICTPSPLSVGLFSHLTGHRRDDPFLVFPL
ncbi:uncharacterized protein CLUP02_00993 [Colletotrichum lupini]|uniref:Uncharacterized protein n=1 Tax=Colletotrichum lupini TaxID=145971 RepID=A0A9Q8W9H8_9PEZI|nr:uncharacterized protein CLUP02_00993 [Colletotrichum lupini]UQC74345.1 hypothetical protein CLUP02_00993 [Colletotrichum lupini]